MKGIMKAARDARGMWIWAVFAAAVGTCMQLFVSDEIKEVFFVATSIVVACGFLTLFATVAPYFKINPNAKLAGMLFFLTSASIYLVLSILILGDPEPADFSDAGPTLPVNAVLAVSLWRFVVGLQFAQVTTRREGHERTRSDDNGS